MTAVSVVPTHGHAMLQTSFVPPHPEPESCLDLPQQTAHWRTLHACSTAVNILSPTHTPMPLCALIRVVSHRTSQIDHISITIVAIHACCLQCPPCRAFTPVLRQFYLTQLAKGRDIEVVFISMDNSKAEFEVGVHSFRAEPLRLVEVMCVDCEDSACCMGMQFMQM